MWQRFTLYDVRIIGHYLGVLTIVLAFALCIPFVTALVFREWIAASHYLLSIGIAFIVGSALRFLHVGPGHLDRRQALTVTALAWIVLALVAAVPLYLSGHYETRLDALFDSVSGFTTTGATIITDLDHLSNADNMWRFVMHLFGGLGLVVVALSLGLFGKHGGASLYVAEGRSEHVVPNIVQTTQFIVKVALAIIIAATVVLTFICLFLGMDPIRAFLHSLWLSISGFTTGGFAPMSQSVMYYHSFSVELILMLVMIFGTFNFVLYVEIIKGRVRHFFQDLEMRTMLVWLSIATLVFAASLSVSTTFSDLPVLLRRGLFMVISAFSTTGYQNITTNQLNSVLTSGAFLILAILMAVGGGGGSTAGGIKFSRLGIIAKSIVVTIKETLAPDSARVVVDYSHAGRHILTPEVAKEAMVVFVLYAITYTFGAFIGIAHGYNATQAIFESISLTSNGGIVSGLAAPGMPITLELLYILQMWAGRLEFVTLFALVVEIVVSLAPRRLVHRS